MTWLLIGLAIGVLIGGAFGYSYGLGDGMKHVALFKGLASDVMDNEAIREANAIWARDVFGPASLKEEFDGGKSDGKSHE